MSDGRSMGNTPTSEKTSKLSVSTCPNRVFWWNSQISSSVAPVAPNWHGLSWTSALQASCWHD